MKKIVVLLLLSLFIISCTTQSDRHKGISLIDNCQFLTSPTEKQIPISEQLTEAYVSQLGTLKGKVPLYRVIRSDEHTFFIGIPYGIDGSQLSKDYGFDPKETDGKFMECYLGKITDQHSEIVVVKLSKNYLLMFAQPNKESSKTIDSDELLNRLEIEKE